MLETTRPRGGTRVLKLQAACPFQAFADLRVGGASAGRRRTRTFGDGAGRRHCVNSLKMFWDEVRDHASLIAMSDGELRAVAESA